MPSVTLDIIDPITVQKSGGGATGTILIGNWTMQKHLDGAGDFLYWDRIFTPDITGNDIQYQTAGNILSARKRLDGYWGFQLDDGTDNMLCAAEVGIISRKGIEPSPADIAAVQAALVITPTTQASYAAEAVSVLDHGGNQINQFATVLQP